MNATVRVTRLRISGLEFRVPPFPQRTRKEWGTLGVVVRSEGRAWATSPD